MNRHEDMNDEKIEQLAREIGQDSLSPEQVSASADRVWARLESEIESQGDHQLRSCADHQALIPALLDGTLGAAQSLLVEDHTRECIPCRRALMKARAGETESAPETRRKRRFPLTRYAGIAASLFAVVIIGVMAWQFVPLAGPGMTIQSVDGQLFSVTHPEKGPLATGTEVPRNEVVRTGRDSAAFLTLADGSVLELSPRSEISVSSRRSGTTVNLERGHVIVEAAKQRRGKLYVATDDCLVSVTGTVFSVKSGTKGSRVSVIEGEVSVDHAGQDDVLHPGDQVSTHSSLVPVSIKDEIAWSQQVDKHLALLEELVALQKELREKTYTPDLRHSSELLELVTHDTTVYFAMPNVAQTLVDTHRIFNERIGQSPVLHAWWQDVALPSGLDTELSRAVATIGDFGQTLGPEIVFAVAGIEEHQRQAPDLLLLATLDDPGAFRALLDEQIQNLEQRVEQQIPLNLVEDPLTAATTPSEGEEFYLWIDGDLLAGAPSLDQLRSLAARRRGDENGFKGTGFYNDLKRSYDDGVAWLVGADLERIIDMAVASSPEMQSEVLQLAVLGVTDLQRLIAEHKTSSGDTVDRATVTFSQPRRGVAGFLAEPAPMGSLDFISPEATAVVAVALKEPRVLAEEWIKIATQTSPSFAAEKDDPQAALHLEATRRFVSKLGGETILALDGPLLPKPAWKFVLEVYDPAGFQQDMEWFLGQIEAEFIASHPQMTAMRLESEPMGSRTAHTLHLPNDLLAIHYTFADGYLVATPSRGLLERAMRFYDSGSNLGDSPRFIGTLPADGNVDFSALVYQDVSAKLGPMISSFANVGANKFSPEQQAMLQRIGENTPASLFYAYAGETLVTLGHSAPEGALDAATLISLMGALPIQDMLGGASASPSPGTVSPGLGSGNAQEE